MALTDNLISFWELGEASGTRSDSAGTNHLSPGNAPGSTTGKVGNAVQLTAGSFQSLILTSNATIQCGDIDFSFCAWFYGDTFPGAYLIAKDDGSSRDYFLYADSTLVDFGVFIAGPTIKEAVVSASYSTATWYFAICWHDATANTVNCQVNDGTVTSTATTGALQAATTVDFRIGASSSPGNFHNGRVDQVGFWKRTLTTPERTWLYNAGAGRSYADIVAESASAVTLMGVILM